MGAPAADIAARIVKVHPAPMALMRGWMTATAAAAILHRTRLEDACAVEGAWRLMSTTRVFAPCGSDIRHPSISSEWLVDSTHYETALNRESYDCLHRQWNCHMLLQY